LPVNHHEARLFFLLIIPIDRRIPTTRVLTSRLLDGILEIAIESTAFVLFGIAYLLFVLRKAILGFALLAFGRVACKALLDLVPFCHELKHQIF